MRVLLINTSERIGGAAVAASRLMESLKNNGIKAKLLVRDKQTDQITVVSLNYNWRMIWKFVWERIVIWKANRFKKENIFAVDIANTGTDITSLPEFQQADVIHLHWINQGMLSLKNIEKILASGKPVVWTMHDMWPCPGICHHARECTRYQQECGNCPFIHGNGSRKDLSYRTFRKKQELYQGRHINFVTCSHWLEGLAKKSALLAGHTITCIPNPINTNLFKPHNKQEARNRCHGFHNHVGQVLFQRRGDEEVYRIVYVYQLVFVAHKVQRIDLERQQVGQLLRLFAENDDTELRFQFGVFFRQ